MTVELAFTPSGRLTAIEPAGQYPQTPLTPAAGTQPRSPKTPRSSLAKGRSPL